VLLVSSLLAAAGLYFLATAAGVGILVWATIYGTGQCYFWPVMQGICAERFPKGGALTMNAIGGMGMLAVGIVGMQLLGFWQDTKIDCTLAAECSPQVYERLMEDKAKTSIFGSYRALDQDHTAIVRYALTIRDEQQKGVGPQDPHFQLVVKNLYNKAVKGGKAADTSARLSALKAAGLVPLTADKLATFKEDNGLVTTAQTAGKRYALQMVAILPIIMACCYLGLIFYFKSKGGYKVVDLVHADGTAAPAATVEGTA